MWGSQQSEKQMQIQKKICSQFIYIYFFLHCTRPTLFLRARMGTWLEDQLRKTKVHVAGGTVWTRTETAFFVTYDWSQFFLEE